MTREFIERERKVDEAAMALVIAYKDLDFVQPLEKAELTLTHADGTIFKVDIQKL